MLKLCLVFRECKAHISRDESGLFRMPYGDDEYPYDDYDNDNDNYLWRRATN